MKNIKFILALCICLYINKAQSQMDSLSIFDFESAMHYENADFYQIVEAGEDFFTQFPEAAEESGGYSKFSRWKNFWQSRVDKPYSNRGSFNNYLNAYLSLLSQPPICPSGTGDPSNWELIGRTTNSSGSSWPNLGILISVAVDPLNPNIVYVGSNSGGLFKTTNFLSAFPNPFWTNITDNTHLPGLGITSIAIDPSNTDIIYITTGIGSAGGYGVGILKSTDGGNTWIQKNPTSFQQRLIAYKIIIDPTSPNILFAIISEQVFKSVDGGDTWSLSFQLPNSIGQDPYNPNSPALFLKDIEMNPADPNNLYICTDDRLSAIIFGNNTGAVAYSTNDGGVNWNLMNIQTGGTQTELIKLAVTPAEPNSVYASYSDPFTGYVRIKKSLDNGLTWNLISSPTLSISGFGYWRNDIAISPVDVNIVYIAGYYVNKSLNAGFTFSQQTSGHVDLRVINMISGSAIPGGANDVLLAGNDGGIIYTVNGGTNWIDKNGTGLVISQYYGIGVAEQNDLVAGGMQDNDVSILLNSNWSIPTLSQDGSDVVVDINNPNILYVQKWCCCATCLPIKKYFYNGTNWTDLGNFQPAFTSAHNIRPMIMLDNNYLYTGYQDVFQSSTPNLSWTKISDFSLYGAGNQNIMYMDVAPSNPNVIYSLFPGPCWGCTNYSAYLFKTTIGGGTTFNSWTDITLNLPPVIPQWIPMQRIAIDPNNENRLWIGCGGLEDDGGPGPYNGEWRVIKSVDGGVSWIDYSDNLPQFPISDIVYEKGTNDGLYAATDVGVFYTNANIYPTQGWICFSKNFPAVVVNDLEIDYCANLIYAGTHGRGIWASPLAPSITTIVNATWNTNQKITTDLLITGTLTINAVDVDIARGRKITVAPGGMLDINGGHLFNGCNEMWDKIDVDGPTALLRVHNGATIEDAVNASFTNNGGVIQIEDASDYKDNYNHVHIEGVTSLPYAGYVKGSTFECPNTLQDPTVGTKTFNPIEIRNSVNITIGDDAGAGLTNTIKDFLNYGIKVISSYATIINNDISTTASATATGVFANNLMADTKVLYVGTTQSGSTAFSKNTFHDLNRGVYIINGISPFVMNNDFTTIGFKAVFASQCYKQITINNNTIQNCPSLYIGIHTRNNPRTTSITILTNTEDLYENAIGIKVEEPVMMDLPKVNIRGNNIFAVKHGIWVIGEANPFITDNSIEFHNAPPNNANGIGVFIQNCYLPDIELNRINSITNYQPFRGIQVEQSTSPYICDNLTDHLIRGITCRGKMLGSKVKVNMMSNCTYGFVLANGGNIGEQGDPSTGDVSDNQWINCFNGETYSTGLSNIGALGPPYTKFYTRPSPTEYTIVNPQADPGSGLITGTILTPYNAADCADHSGWRPMEQITETITDTTENDSTLTYEEIWIGDKATYEFTMRDSSIDTTVLVINTYLNTMEATPIGQFKKIEGDINAAYADTINFSTDSSKIADADNRNEQIDQNRLIDYYKRIAMEIYLNTIARDIYEFTTEQQNWITFIAPMCPFEGGPAVYIMRVMYTYIDEQTHFNDDDCDENAVILRKANSKNQTGILHKTFVYPNPAKNEAHLVYDLQGKSEAAFNILNNQGAILISLELNNQSTEKMFDISSLSNGLYHFRIYSGKQLIDYGKFSVIK